MRLKNLLFVVLLPLLSATFLVPLQGVAGSKKDMGGWEIDGKYNQHYDPSEMDSFKGNIAGIKKIVPIKGMSPGVALLVRDRDGEVILVHVCPLWFSKPNKMGVRNGDKVKVKGVWAEIDGKEVFMASKIKKGSDFEFKVRLTSDGTPFWTMTPEQLDAERQNK